MIYKCNCKPHPYQDKTYGYGMRIHNASDKDKLKIRCTVCGKDNARVKGGKR